MLYICLLAYAITVLTTQWQRRSQRRYKLIQLSNNCSKYMASILIGCIRTLSLLPPFISHSHSLSLLSFLFLLFLSIFLSVYLSVCPPNETTLTLLLSLRNNKIGNSGGLAILRAMEININLEVFE